MSDENRQRLLELTDYAVKNYDRESQFDMAVEECSELITEIARIGRGRTTDDSLAEEICGTYLMMEEMMMYLGYETINRAMASQLDKFEKHVNNSKATRAVYDYNPCKDIYLD